MGPVFRLRGGVVGCTWSEVKIQEENERKGEGGGGGTMLVRGGTWRI